MPISALRSLLDEPGIIHDQNPPGPPSRSATKSRTLSGTAFSAPGRAGQQPLRPVRGDVTGLHGKLPTVLSAHRPQQATNVVAHP